MRCVCQVSTDSNVGKSCSSMSNLDYMVRENRQKSVLHFRFHEENGTCSLGHVVAKPGSTGLGDNAGIYEVPAVQSKNI